MTIQCMRTQFFDHHRSRVFPTFDTDIIFFAAFESTADIVDRTAKDNNRIIS